MNARRVFRAPTLSAEMAQAEATAWYARRPKQPVPAPEPSAKRTWSLLLRRYGSHDAQCAWRTYDVVARGTGPCTCGFAATLKTYA